jgi:FMN phosphatase YigB (HAD superfamily)
VHDLIELKQQQQQQRQISSNNNDNNNASGSFGAPPAPLYLVAFSNGPRQYVKRVLQHLGLWDTVFTESTLFAVEDVLPHCKPEAQAFQAVLTKIAEAATTPNGKNRKNDRAIRPEECVMVEDSMKNIRCAKALGMKTVWITGDRRISRSWGESSSSSSTDENSHGTQPQEEDHDHEYDSAAVDVAIEMIADLRTALPGLWETPAIFSSSSSSSSAASDR